MPDDHPVVSRAEWIEARKRFLAREKEFTRLRDELSAERRALPWVRVEKEYMFEGPDGAETLPELFAGRSQLIVQHFMLGAGWREGCKSCSFWADNYDGIDVHLAARDVTFLAVSSAPFPEIAAFKARMGWHFKWVSCAGSDFNRDYQVSFGPDAPAGGEVEYNYRRIALSATEMPGVSVFCRDAEGTVFHTYSCYARGLDILNGAYHYLDLTPKGRDEAGLRHSMEWVRLHDHYGA
ncbi:MAG TPA: thioredoxin family protein [Stellaceae bacterium]|nr:thioredoxin family protein [Stellaceae bacterium]